MRRIDRLYVEPRDRQGDGNIIQYYSIDHADWVWVNEDREEVFQAEFRIAIELPEAKETVVHVSADQRYELFWNDGLLGRGPDRSDLRHWAFASYRLSLPAGRHEFHARVTYLGEKAPVAQESFAPGFIFAADGLEELLNTGQGAWMGKALKGIGLRPGLTHQYHVIGPGFDIDGEEYFSDEPLGKVRTVRKVLANPHGIVTPGLVLHPSRLPDQKSVNHVPDRVLSALESDLDNPWDESKPELLIPWRELLQGKPLEVPANTRWRCLLDLGDYYCGYPELEVSGGAGSEIQIEWVESLVGSPDSESLEKGNRDEWKGKYFYGFGDRFYPDGPSRVFKSLWWRSGRYLQVYLKTGDTPLLINRLEVDETGYPTDFSARFECSDQDMESLIAIMERGLECCGHEIMVDCPYYEQLSYVGDTRLQALCWLVLGRDDRLVKRELELFDWSRYLTGYVAERYPSHPFQLSLTFSMIWVLMLGDFSKWRDDAVFVKARMPGMRSLLDQLLNLRNDKGLLERLPGWSFVDWVDEWECGIAPGGRNDTSAVLDLFFLQALQTARDLEESFGEPELAARWERLANEHSNAIRKAYWDSSLGLFTDIPGNQSHLCLHAQCLAVIAGLLSSDDAKKLMSQAMQSEGMIWPSPYFQFYLFEALTIAGLGDSILDKMDLWRSFRAKGLKTPPEKEDPTRSDCHAWGSHPLYHLHASIAGIRPAGPGMEKVRIAPAPGKLSFLRSEIPVTKGIVSLDLEFDGDKVAGSVSLPEGLSGDFYWGSQFLALDSGKKTNISLTLQ